MASPPAHDRLARPLRDLRISVTDRCNLRCRYCMPREVYGAGFRYLPRSEILDFEEIARLTRVFARLGVRRIRLTGGEPLLRRELERLVELLVRIEGIEEIAMTTNGLLLAGSAHTLARAGLTRVTVSLDALDDGVLRAIGDAPLSARRVLAGIDAAADASLRPVKVNMVVRRGVNEQCATEMADHFRHSGAVLRFIEYMDVGASNGWRLEEVVPAQEILQAVAARWPLEPIEPSREGEVASRYRYRDGAGEIGVIHSVSKPFCGGCTRARLSADGKLFTCLFARRGSDLRELLRAGASDLELERRLREVWEARADRYSVQRSRASEGTGRDGDVGEEGIEGIQAAAGDPPGPKIEMSYIGG
jgi:cyclic pyranopterin phosphate synthase